MIVNPKLFELSELVDKLSESSKWADSYFRLLSIMDHIRECCSKYEMYKLHALNSMYSKEDLHKELEKELMDLYILLGLEFKPTNATLQTSDDNTDDPPVELMITRLKKFIEKL